MGRRDLRKLFDEIPDPRVQRTRRHRLTDVLLLVEALLGKHWHAVTKIASSLEAGERVPSSVVRGVLREAKSEI